MLCNSVRAVFVGVLITPPVGWLEVFLQAAETCPNSEKTFTNRQGFCLSSNELGPTLTTMRKLSAGWPAILTKLSAGFPATFCRTSNLLWGQPRSPGLRGGQKSLLSSFSVRSRVDKVAPRGINKYTAHTFTV